MVIDPKIRRIYSQIQKQLFYMIPEKWNKVYLYSSILERQNNLKTGELYFYYIPIGILKKNPVNVYEIPNRFSINEDTYLKQVDKLYSEIKKLQKVFIESGEEKWKGVIISIADFKFNVEYFYDDFGNSKFTSYEKHLIFRYRYLEYPITSFNKNERNVIERYINEVRFNKTRKKVYSEVMYEMPFETIEIGSKNSNIQYVKEDDERLLLLEEKKEFKSQILKSGF